MRERNIQQIQHNDGNRVEFACGPTGVIKIIRKQCLQQLHVHSDGQKINRKIILLHVLIYLTLSTRFVVLCSELFGNKKRI